MAEPLDWLFLRPWWLLAWPLFILLWWQWRRRYREQADPWRQAVDPQLLDALRGQPISTDRTLRFERLAGITTPLGAALVCLALAGPSLGEQAQPPAARRDAVVAVLAVNAASGAADIKPNRLQRAIFKLRDLFRLARDRDIGMVIYAGSAHVLSPLTRDWHTIDNQLAALSPDLLPVAGNRVDLALARAGDLLRQAGATHGDVLLLSPDAGSDPAASEREAKRLAAQGYRLHVIGLGSPEGAPIPRRGGGFELNEHGGVRYSRLLADQLQGLVDNGGGRYQPLAVDDRDLHAALASGALVAGADGAESKQQGGRKKAARRRDDGVWLLPLAALLMLTRLRREEGE